MLTKLPIMFSRRIFIATTFLIFSLSACGAPKMTVTLDIVYFNYLDRPIYNASIDGKASRSLDPFPETGGSTISGVSLSIGPKVVSWILDGPAGAPRNGEKVSAKNSLHLSDIPDDAQYLSIHIYPDETVELIPSRHYPRATERGISSASKRSK
ncbi:hypothetical protein OU994_11350 [Pseudoduganella sp. SL102]|uniref:hypothetical protein n=1 Tax=Pseudoduganella sp. SL102 TaxID=2995154 RepID=UPI00248CAA08|nr:hypothetical protein [Pseudoduganella sp. SL102]WBS04821.1 hypothetical protein OU994_11350 [Pseudoduganella sp. SL102]